MIQGGLLPTFRMPFYEYYYYYFYYCYYKICANTSACHAV